MKTIASRRFRVLFTFAFLFLYSPLAIAQEDDPVAQQLADELVIKANNSILKIIDLLAKHPEYLEKIELVGFQKEELEALNSKFADKLKELENFREEDGSKPSEKVIEDEKRKLARAHRDAIRKTLLPHQLLDLAKMGIYTAGLPKALTESPLGAIIELTDSQKDRIQDRSQRLAEKIEKFMHESRQELHDIVAEELNKKQENQIRELYTSKIVDYYFSEISLTKLYNHLIMDVPDDPAVKRHPAVVLKKTKIKKSK